MICGKALAQWRQDPTIADLADCRETFWRNPEQKGAAEGLAQSGLSMADVEDAAARLGRFAPYIAQAFPETAAAGGIIESPCAKFPKCSRRWPGNGTWIFQGNCCSNATVICPSPAPSRPEAAFMKC